MPLEVHQKAREQRSRAPRDTWDVDPGLLERTKRQADITEMYMAKYGR